MKMKKLMALFMMVLILLLPVAFAEEIAPETPADPVIQLNVPNFSTKTRMTFQGTTEPYSTVTLMIDGINAGLLNPSFTGEEGKILFSDKYIGETGTTHTIKIKVQTEDGRMAEQESDVTVDSEAPDIQLLDIPDMIVEEGFSIEGTVTEPSTFYVYVLKGEEDTIAPAKVAGIKQDQVDKNIVKFFWTPSEEEDLYGYLIYRSDVGAIEVMQKGYAQTSFTDFLVNSDNVYSYQVAAIDTAGNIGLKSDLITVTTLAEGKTDFPLPEEREVSFTVDPTYIINASEKFNISINFEEDGTYRIKIIGIDDAGNKVEIVKKVIVDTKPPEITITYPENGAFFYEHYADEVDVEGVTEPNARVYLYIERTPFGQMDQNFNLDIFPEEVQDLTHAKLGADCRLRIDDIGYCKNAADYDTKADAKGHFKFKEVDLTSGVALGLRAQMVDPIELERRDRNYDIYNQQTKDSRLLFLATDAAGHVGTTDNLMRYAIGTCWSGNFSWDATPLLQYQSPTFLSSERLAEGTERIYFYLNFSYAGVEYADSAKVTQVHIESACDRNMMKDARFNRSCNIFRACSEGRGNADGNTWYFSCSLGTIEGMDRWLEEDWKGFFNAINNEMTFPLKVTLSYTVGNSNRQIRQTSCEEVTYTVDNSRIDFRKLPDWMLYDTVDFLQKSSETLTDVMDRVETVLEWTGTLCIFSFAVKFGTTVYRRIICTISKVPKPLQGVETKEQIACKKNCFANSVPAIVPLDTLSDYCLEQCAPRCAAAWKKEEKVYKVYRGLCDRVFCHTAPAGWTESKTDEVLEEKKISQRGVCDGIDASVRGQVIRKEKCKDLQKRYSEFMKFTVDPFDECFEIYRMTDKDELGYVYTFADNSPISGSNNIYKLVRNENRKSKTPVYAIKQTETTYLTPSAKECKDICKENGYLDDNGEESICITSTECTNWTQDIGGKKLQQYGTRYGYTSDCPDIGSDDTKALTYLDPSETNTQREECCCIGVKGKEYSRYYQADDVTMKGLLPAFTAEQKIMGTGEQLPKFSYRYNRIGFKTKDGKSGETHDEYNPYRYVEGRDKWGCFGQDRVAITGDNIMHDPFKSHISSFQCLCISGIYKRLEAIRNIMEALKNCLIEVRETGSADSGVCKEIFSQYVCGMIWRMIQYTRTGCIEGNQGKSLIDMDNKWLSGFGIGMDSVFGAVDEMGDEMGKEYGNTKLNNFLGMGEESVARKVCLAAFGYDWELDLKEAIDISYVAPMATLVMAITRSKEYLTFNPSNGQSTYEYRSSWLINPGCDMENYDVYLSCISTEEYNSNPGTKCDEEYECDCLGLNNEQTVPFYDGKLLTSGVLEDTDWHDVLTMPYRYDHLKFVLRPDREIRRAELRENCFPEGHEDGVFYFPIRDKTATDIAACYVDGTSGTFKCPEGDLFWGEKGEAYFIEKGITINGQIPEEVSRITLNEGDSISLGLKVWKSGGPDVCARVVIQDAGQEIETYIPIVVEGEHQYPEREIMNDVRIRVRGELTPVDGLTMALTGQQTYVGDTASFNVQFVDAWGDDTDGQNDKIDFCDKTGSKDRVIFDGIGEEIGKICDSNGGRFILKSSNGIQVQITQVGLFLRNVDNPKNIPVGDKFEDSRSFLITASRVATNREYKNMGIDLVRLKQGKQIYGGPGDCNEGDIIRYNGQAQQVRYDNKVEVTIKSGQRATTTTTTTTIWQGIIV